MLLYLEGFYYPVSGLSNQYLQYSQFHTIEKNVSFFSESFKQTEGLFNTE
jgi:hypothetical protein